MKKLILAILSFVCAATPTFAGIHIEPENVRAIVQQYVAPEKVNATISEYNAQLRAAAGAGISGDKMWKVCTAAGWDVKKSAGKQSCETFVRALVENASFQYYNVCDADKNKTGGEEHCIDNFFTNKGYGGIQVTENAAIALSQEYARLKHNDTIRCDNKYDKKWTDDIINCASINKNAYYSFVFDDVTESDDKTVRNDTVKAVCKMYDAKYTAGGCTGGGTNVSAGSMSCWNAYCTADDAKCKNINTSMEKFGYTAAYTDGKCEIDFHQINSAADLRNDFKPNISDDDKFIFCSKDMQVRNTQTLEDRMREFISGKILVPKASVTCVPGDRKYTGDGCHVKGINLADDIKTCSVGGKYIDFVFDDLHENRDKRVEGGMQGITCITSGGTFDSKNCVSLDETACNNLKDKMKKDYPDSQDIYWNGKLCVLPTAKANAIADQVTEYAIKTGIAVAAITATVVSGGAATTFLIIADATMITGEVISATSDAVMMFGVFGPFVEKAQQCLVEKTPVCAENFLKDKEYIQKMVSYKQEFSPQEQVALDEILSKLVTKVPDDSDLWEDFFNDPELFVCDKDGMNCAVKEKMQFWQAARLAGNVMQIAGGLMHLVGSVKQLPKTFEQIQAKVVGNMKGQPMLKHFNTVDETTGAIISNAQLEAWGYNATNTQLVKNMGWTVGQQVTLNSMAGLVINAKPNGMALIAIADGIGHGGYNLGKRADPTILSRNKGNNTPAIADTSAQETTPVVAPVSTPTPAPTSTPVVAPVVAQTPTLNTTPVVAPTPAPETSASISVYGVNRVATNNNTVVTPVNAPDININTKPKHNAGAIAAAVVGGTVLGGLAIGGIVAATGKDSSSDSNATHEIKVDTDLENLMVVASGVIGVVDDRNLTLVRMPTTVNTYAPIVMIDGNAVVVVSFNDYKLPFYLNGTTWSPLLGIGENGRWFNVYPTSGTSSGIAKVDEITSQLNRQLNPVTVSRYVGGANGVTFPTAAQTAFTTINAEFPNGVVQSRNMTAADRKLYSENYAMMQSKMK